ncbi:MAG: hypothetical protein ACTHQM_25690 [Thermoanaerobaculia bacterium]
MNVGRVASFLLRIAYSRVINYIAEHPELDGATVRLRIRSVFGTSVSAATLQKLIELARRRAAK